MPTKGTKARGVRGVSDAKWEAFKAKAADNGETASDVLRRAVDDYLSAEPELHVTSLLFKDPDDDSRYYLCSCGVEYGSVGLNDRDCPRGAK